jgi:predicted nucleic acid-binding protein
VRAFIDTNVAVYAFGPQDDPRCVQADVLLARQGSSIEFVISTQVLLETYNVLLRRKQVRSLAALAVARLLQRFEVVAPSADAALSAMELAAAHQLPTFDAFIVQAALEAGCDTLFSEDLQAGRRFGPLEVINPFDAAAHEAIASHGKAARKPRKSPSLRSSRPSRVNA